ncbi:MAG: hypothetical protein HY343_07000 [Lentisphaerae bacterium]|nr:hypothetical protein [Lentisphaerota bacterium]
MIQVRKRHTILPLKILLGFSLACYLLTAAGPTNPSGDKQPSLLAEDRAPTLLGAIPTAMATAVPSTPGDRAELLPEGLVALRVDNSAPYERIAEPVTSGIPLPRVLAITDPNEMVLLDAAGNPVAAQYTVTARWGGAPNDATRPIRWLLADFQASVPAGGTSVYTLARGRLLPPPGIGVADHEGGVAIDTGGATFIIGPAGWLT